MPQHMLPHLKHLDHDQVADVEVVGEPGVGGSGPHTVQVMITIMMMTMMKLTMMIMSIMMITMMILSS